MIKRGVLTLGFSALLLSGCAYMDSSDDPIDGYVLVAQEAHKGASSFKYYVAPESKAVFFLDMTNAVRKAIDTQEVISISIARSWPQGGVQYYVRGYACNHQAGSVVQKRKDSQDWDPRFYVAPFGSVDWKIWQFVCKGTAR